MRYTIKDQVTRGGIVFDVLMSADAEPGATKEQVEAEMRKGLAAIEKGDYTPIEF